jgi:lysophospholipase L1-like esterase
MTGVFTLMPRRTSLAVALFVVAAVFLFVLTRVVAQGTSAPATSYYVALGDSIAHGHTADTVADNPQCHSQKAPGYVCVVYRYLQKKYAGVRVRNFSRSGADSCEVAGAGHSCQDMVPRVSQLVAADAFLKAHRGHIRLVTIDIGGNDILELAVQGLSNLPATEAKLPAADATLRTNLDTIFAELRVAAPHARIVASTQWNPLGGLGTPPLPAGFPAAAQSALDAINGITIAEAAKYKIKVADAAAVMNAYPGGGVRLGYIIQTALTGTPNIHPTPKGHRIWGNTIIKTVFGPSAP